MELRAEDLRCNNILLVDDGKGEPYQITIKGINTINGGHVYDEDDSIHGLDCLKPIPLTEEWLLKFNAIKIHAPYLGFKYSRFKLIWKESYKFWYVLDWVDETYMTKISYVHEFQNFIKSMDNKELQVLQRVKINNMEELDILEKEIIKAITKCSVFDVLTVKNTYLQTKSFDLTIKALKTSQENNIRVSTAISQVMLFDSWEKLQLIIPVYPYSKIRKNNIINY